MQGLSFVTVYIDNILISGCSEKEYLANLNIVLEKMAQAGMQLKNENFVYMMTEVEYLGHKVLKDGIQLSTKKVSIVTNAPRPTNVTEVKAFFWIDKLLQEIFAPTCHQY